MLPLHKPLRLILGAFGDPGHAFPMIALGSELAARGHEVTLETWKKWEREVESEGMRFAAAPEYTVFPTRKKVVKPYEAVVWAARQSAPLIRDQAPDLVLADILTLAPALAGEAAGVPVGTLVPHVYPVGAPGQPPYALGARWARTRMARALWDSLDPLVQNGLRQGRDELNGARERVGLPPVERLHGGLSQELCLVATFPELEYPRDWPRGTGVVGPLMWEPPFGEVELPPGDDPLVLVAPSTVQDPEHRLLRAAVCGLASSPVRVLATLNRRPLDRPLRLPANARLVDWVSYAKTMPRCDVVVCHGGHGTVVRALASGATPVVAPAGGDMNENAARVDWAGLGVRIPGRLVSGPAVRLAVRRALADVAMRGRVRALAASPGAISGPAVAADAVEAWAAMRVPRTQKTA